MFAARSQRARIVDEMPGVRRVLLGRIVLQVDARQRALVLGQEPVLILQIVALRLK